MIILDWPWCHYGRHASESCIEIPRRAEFALFDIEARAHSNSDSDLVRLEAPTSKV